MGILKLPPAFVQTSRLKYLNKSVTGPTAKHPFPDLLLDIIMMNQHELMSLMTGL